MGLESVIWYPRKQISNHGPNLPKSFDLDNALIMCSVSLNQTHLMLMGHLKFSKDFYGHAEVSIIDFQNQKWFPCPSMNVDYILYCKGALGFHKNGSRYLLIS